MRKKECKLNNLKLLKYFPSSIIIADILYVAINFH
ncbi:hypothetical protein MFFDBJGM_00681 [Pectobacterium versatile]|nr:hypothetical protein MFFDBJGM_00681 [Pectobacterium versatile]